jgi:hypothetical protein
MSQNAHANIKQIDQFLQEHCDGYILIAFNPEDQEPMTTVSCKNGKTEAALNSIISGVLCTGGVRGSATSGR